MVAAVITDWDTTLLAGTASSTDGQAYILRYRDGQSFYTSDNQHLPRLTGKHQQQPGYQLKVPQVGDPVLIQLPSPGQTITHWGYMRHYVDVAERRYGTAFVTAAAPSAN